MNRVVIASVAIAALVGASVLGWFEVHQEREFRRLLAAGDAALRRDQTSPAIEAYSGAIALRRDSMLGWLKRGDTYRHRGDYASALRDLEQAAALDPTAPRPIELLGDVNDALGHHAEAVEYYSRFVGLDDRAPRVLYKLALAYYRDGHSAAAMDPLRKALAIDRQLPEAYYLLGLCERDNRHPERAAEAFTRAIGLNPAFPAARDELAAIDLALGRRRDGIEQLDALAALEPDRPDRLIELARVYARSGRVEAAVQTLDRAAERYPGAAGVYLELARLWLDAAEEHHDLIAAAKASEALRHVPASGRGSAEVLLLLGRSQLFAGDLPGAERSFQAATAALPVEPEAFEYLSTAADRLGHRGVARDARARYAALAH